MTKPTIYTLPSCVQCESSKRYLDKQGVEYDTIDMSQDPAAHKYVTELGYSQAPVVVFGDNHWSGFRMERLDGIAKQMKSEEKPL